VLDVTKEFTMKLTHSRPRLDRRSTRLAAPLTIACLLLLALGLAVAGCGASSSSDTTAVTSAAPTTATTPASTDTTAGAALNGSDLGKATGALWVEAMQKLSALLANLPAVDDVKDQVATLKEEYVQKFVALGRQRLLLDTSAQAEADSVTTAALAAAADEDWYKSYMVSFDQYIYMSGDVDFTNLLASFNILTQYSYFELLKSQAPEEAARLGIK
jgi:hypothetical protein